MIKIISMLLIILTLLFASSCWDLVDIEKRAYVIGIAIDKTDDPKEIEVIFQIALPDAFARESGGDTESFWNISIRSKNFIEARRALIRHINWTPTLEHCEILIFGEEYAKDGIKDPLDFFLRSHEVRRLMQVVVVKNGKAKDIMELELKNKRVPSMFISELLAGSKKNFGILDFSFIGIMHENFITNSSMPIASVLMTEDKTLNVLGSGILDRNFKLVGWFDANDNMALSLLREDANLGYMSFNIPDELGGTIMLNVFGVNSVLKPEFRKETLYAVSDIKIEGDIVEIGRTGFSIKADTINKMESKISVDITKIIKNTFYKAQKELNCDPFGFDSKVMNYYPEYWNSIKRNWEEVFNNTRLDINVEVRIRRIGDINY